MMSLNVIVLFLNIFWRFLELFGFLGYRGRVLWIIVIIDLVFCFVEGVVN